MRDRWRLPVVCAFFMKSLFPKSGKYEKVSIDDGLNSAFAIDEDDMDAELSM